MQSEIEMLRRDVFTETNQHSMTFEVCKLLVDQLESQLLFIVLNKFVEELGFCSLGENWIEIDHQSAELIATAIMFRDLAYNAELMAKERASGVGSRFLALFEEPRYFTNGVFDSGGFLRSWIGITNATFDSGLICIDSQRVGILWREDED